MSKATITLEDIEKEVKVNVDFGDGTNDASYAHYLALIAFQAIQKELTKTQEEDNE